MQSVKISAAASSKSSLLESWLYLE